MQVYWSSVFLLPKSVVKQIEQKLRNFLWSGKHDKSTKAKVKWELVCNPMSSGGLGIPRLAEWNKAAQIKHIWHLCKGGWRGLWVDWIYSNYLKGRSFWSVGTPATCSWIWKKLLKLRPLVRDHFRWEVNDGLSISLWSDYWLPTGPMDSIYSAREIANSGLPTKARLVSLMEGDDWCLLSNSF